MNNGAPPRIRQLWPDEDLEQLNYLEAWAQHRAQQPPLHVRLCALLRRLFRWL